MASDNPEGLVPKYRHGRPKGLERDLRGRPIGAWPEAARRQGAEALEEALRAPLGARARHS